MAQSSDPFSRLSDGGRQAVARGARSRVFARGAAVIEKGDPVSGAYVVTRGKLRVYTMTPSGKEATLYEIGPGETCVLAINALFNDLLYPAWVEAEAETDVAVVPGALYRALFEREPAIQQLTVHALSSVVLRLMTELEEVHSHRVDQRLASFLLNQASSEGVVRKTQQEIASHIGTTREVVAKAVGEFVSRRWIESGRGRVKLLQPRMLAALVKRNELS
ncbi:Crp/Fnr family transcriptional regulator [Oricola sp.]|uniref:Crp/Fnr family transcriptional regulator n=1 Tax=Oricola sp. TaxID=1979950 RepID=UPI0025F62BE7|nr:Crp/Fnr family transcriptional regulator [Oricola sp.]MCI5076694.1 Crp/Fnr family transcriptional regulator [Oricola sp.]